MKRWNPAEARLMSGREVVGDCWVWTGLKNNMGYGRIYAEGRSWYVHRYSYTLHKGPIPDGYEVDHLCRNALCFAPDHLEAVTPRVNKLRSDAPSAKAVRTGFCGRGHELTPENVYTRKDNGHRMCWPCQQARNKIADARRRAKRKAARAEV